MAAHAAFLLKHCWKAQVTLSLPRLRPCAGEFQPLTNLSDRELVQLIAALRLFLPDAGLVLSTREPAPLRDGLFPLGITHASAGSHTEPGGYTGAGNQNVHQTVRGRILELAADNPALAPTAGRSTNATGQLVTVDGFNVQPAITVPCPAAGAATPKTPAWPTEPDSFHSELPSAASSAMIWLSCVIT